MTFLLDALGVRSAGCLALTSPGGGGGGGRSSGRVDEVSLTGGEGLETTLALTGFLTFLWSSPFGSENYENLLDAYDS